MTLLKVSFYRPQTRFEKVMFLHVAVSHSVWGGVVSEHALQVVSQHALQVSRGRGVCIPACLAGFQAHTQGELEGSDWGGLQAHPQGELEGSGLGGLQAHTQGEVEGSGHGGSPGPHLGRFQAHIQGGCRPTPGGVSRPTPGGGAVYPSML